MSGTSLTKKCDHHNRRRLRKVTVIQRGNTLTTGVRIAGGKDFILVPAKNPNTRRYNWLVHCTDCLEILQGEPYVP